MPAILLTFLRDFAASRIGQIIIAFAVAWLWSGHRADERCAEREAAAIAAAQQAVIVERAREAKATDELRAKDRLNIHMANAHADAMQAEIDRLNSAIAKKGPVHEARKADDCRIDRARVRRVQQIDKAGNR
ncbi:hypothetical protein [Methylocystis parvus]|uniref:hypothetical protein n=1 Tax=Methylocystis parvus TaxID=134 RepID=UPI003C726F62